MPEAPPRAEQPAPDSRVAKITLLLVLGHHFERLVRDGVVKDYAEIARRTGLTRARVTQIVNMTLLAPDIQESILASPVTDGSGFMDERSLRAIVAELNWNRRRAIFPSGRSTVCSPALEVVAERLVD